jgi:hypothetical protein
MFFVRALCFCVLYVLIICYLWEYLLYGVLCEHTCTFCSASDMIVLLFFSSFFLPVCLCGWHHDFLLRNFVKWFSCSAFMLHSASYSTLLYYLLTQDEELQIISTCLLTSISWDTQISEFFSFVVGSNLLPHASYSTMLYHLLTQDEELQIISTCLLTSISWDTEISIKKSFVPGSNLLPHDTCVGMKHPKGSPFAVQRFVLLYLWVQ